MHLRHRLLRHDGVEKLHERADQPRRVDQVGGAEHLGVHVLQLGELPYTRWPSRVSFCVMGHASSIREEMRTFLMASTSKFFVKE